MAKKYEPPKETGREYVDKTTEFCNYTHMRCDRLPKRWRETYLYPMIRAADEIEALTRKANKVYINEKNMDAAALAAAYQQRIGMLTQALSGFADFDAKFERLMGMIDIAGAEKRRLAGILRGIIQSEKAANPDVKKIEIRVRSHADDMEYISLNGDAHMKLALTRKNRDTWLRYERDSMNYIRKRIAADKKRTAAL